ncbi:8-oxo-dGTP diphosphatase [Sorochytrium milnesiophthora]
MNDETKVAVERLRQHSLGPKDADHQQIWDLALANNRASGVLVPLVCDATSGELQVLLTLRSSTLSRYAGHVAFPGGKRDPSDVTIVDTALREAQEEVGINPANVTVLTRLSPWPSMTGYVVYPIISIVEDERSADGGDITQRLRTNAAEVEATFLVPLHVFISKDAMAKHGVRYGWEDVPFLRGTYRVHEFFVTYGGREFRVWGLTAAVCIATAEIAFAREPDFHPPVSIMEGRRQIMERAVDQMPKL